MSHVHNYKAITDAGYAHFAPEKKKAQRLWQSAILKVIHENGLKSKHLPTLTESLIGRLGINQRGTHIRPHYFDEVINPKRQPAYPKDANDKFMRETRFTEDANHNGLIKTEGNRIFVVDHAGRIFDTIDRPDSELYHSSLAAGSPVFAAGQITVSGGKIQSLSNSSGHYHPKTSGLMARFLLSKNVNLFNIKMSDLDQNASVVYQGNAYEYAKISGEKFYQDYLSKMNDVKALEEGIAGTLELHLPLFHDNEVIYPMHIAAEAPCSSEVMEFLLDNGCDPNVISSSGKTPLGILCESDNPDLGLIKQLLVNGANAHQPHGKMLQSPLEIAKAKNNPELIKLLSDNPEPEVIVDKTDHLKNWQVTFENKQEFEVTDRLWNQRFNIPYDSNKKEPFISFSNFDMFIGDFSEKTISDNSGNAVPMVRGEVQAKNGMISFISNRGTKDPQSFHIMMRYLAIKYPIDKIKEMQVEVYDGEEKLEFSGSWTDYIKKYGKKQAAEMKKELLKSEDDPSVLTARPKLDWCLPVVYPFGRSAKIVSKSPFNLLGKTPLPGNANAFVRTLQQDQELSLLLKKLTS